MKQVLKCNIKAGAKRTNGPRLWKHNTDLCVDIKTLLCRDRVAKVGKSYYGVLKHDRIGHYTFKEHSLPAPKAQPARLRRTPHHRHSARRWQPATKLQASCHRPRLRHIRLRLRRGQRAALGSHKPHRKMKTNV